MLARAREQPEKGLSNVTSYRIGIVTDGLEERVVDGEIRIANGGVGVYIYQLIRHLLEIDGKNEYFLIRYSPGLHDIYHHPKAHPILPRLQGLKTPQIILDRPYRRLAQELRLDVIHFPNQFGGAFLPSSIRRVATLHDLIPLLLARTHPVRRVMFYLMWARLSLRRCDRIIVPSNSTRADLIRKGFARAENITIVPCGVSHAFRPEVRTHGFMERHSLTRPFILNVGVLEPRKNHVLLVEVLKRLRESGEEVDLVMIGREGWRWVNPVNQPEYGALRPYVHIFQDVPESELIEFYGRAAVFVYPSLYEGFGLPMVEAMACGTPVVASDTSSLPEVGQGAALYASPRDAAGFAAHVLRLLRDAELRSRMIVAAVERARQFSWRRTAKSTLQVYESLCDRAALRQASTSV